MPLARARMRAASTKGVSPWILRSTVCFSSPRPETRKPLKNPRGGLWAKALRASISWKLGASATSSRTSWNRDSAPSRGPDHAQVEEDGGRQQILRCGRANALLEASAPFVLRQTEFRVACHDVADAERESAVCQHPVHLPGKRQQ